MWSRQRTLLSVLGGVSLLLTSATVYTVATSFNPFFWIVGTRKLANVAAYVYLLVVLAYWSALLRALLEDGAQVLVAIGSFLAAGVAVVDRRFAPCAHLPPVTSLSVDP